MLFACVIFFFKFKKILYKLFYKAFFLHLKKPKFSFISKFFYQYSKISILFLGLILLELSKKQICANVSIKSWKNQFVFSLFRLTFKWFLSLQPRLFWNSFTWRSTNEDYLRDLKGGGGRIWLLRIRRVTAKFYPLK